jgi:Protein of unknown function (DUF1488)
MLVTLNEPGQELGGGIRFMMLDGLTRVVCWVSREALDEVEGGDASQQDRVGRFERHRLKIEKLAGRKHAAGERSPIVMTYDLRTLL